MSTSHKVLKLGARLMQKLINLFSDDPFLHHRLAVPVVRVLAKLPSRYGTFWGQVLDYLEKRQREAVTIREFEAKLASLDENSICLDLGANVGHYTLRMAKYAGHVHAFEPDPWAFAKLTDNLKGLTNVTLHNAAVGAETGMLRLFRDPDFEVNPDWASLGSTTLQRADVAMGEGIDIPCVALAQFIASLDADIALVKMDIEGAEVAVLEALYSSDAIKRIEALFIETHYHTFPEQILPMADLKQRYGALSRPITNFDWP